MVIPTSKQITGKQTEAQFALHNITDCITKYFTFLDPVVAERMAGDVAAVPTEGKYKYLNSKLVEVYGFTDDQKADRLLDLSGLGDWKPSQLCEHIQSLTVSQDVLMQRIFLCRLPEDVYVQVTVLDADTLPALARKANVIMAAKWGPPSIYASSLPMGKKSPPHHPEKTNLCWYYAKFGHKASWLVWLVWL